MSRRRTFNQPRPPQSEATAPVTVSVVDADRAANEENTMSDQTKSEQTEETPAEGTAQQSGSDGTAGQGEQPPAAPATPPADPVTIAPGGAVSVNQPEVSASMVLEPRRELRGAPVTNVTVDEVGFTENDAPVVARSRSAATVATVIAEYKALMGRAVLNDADLARGAGFLKRIVDTLIKKPESDALDLFYAFVKDEAEGLMHPRMALRGIQSLDRAGHDKVSMMVALIRDHIVGRPLPKGGAVEALKRMFDNKADILIYLQSK